MKPKRTKNGAEEHTTHVNPWDALDPSNSLPDPLSPATTESVVEEAAEEPRKGTLVSHYSLTYPRDRLLTLSDVRCGHGRAASVMICRSHRLRNSKSKIQDSSVPLAVWLVAAEMQVQRSCLQRKRYGRVPASQTATKLLIHRRKRVPGILTSHQEHGRDHGRDRK